MVRKKSGKKFPQKIPAAFWLAEVLLFLMLHVRNCDTSCPIPNKVLECSYNREMIYRGKYRNRHHHVNSLVPLFIFVFISHLMAMTEKTTEPCYMHIQGSNCGSETVGREVLRMEETWIFLYMHVFPVALTFHTNNHAEYCTQPALQA